MQQPASTRAATTRGTATTHTHVERMTARKNGANTNWSSTSFLTCTDAARVIQCVAPAMHERGCERSLRSPCHARHEASYGTLPRLGRTATTAPEPVMMRPNDEYLQHLAGVRYTLRCAHTRRIDNSDAHQKCSAGPIKTPPSAVKTAARRTLKGPSSKKSWRRGTTTREKNGQCSPACWSSWLVKEDDDSHMPGK